MDTRQLGKPESLGSAAGGKDWSFVFGSYASASSALLASLLERTERANRVLNTSLAMRVMLCKATALTRVNAGAQEGLEAWRALCLAPWTRNAGMLQELLNFSFEGEIAVRMVQFDRDIDHGTSKKHLVLNRARLTTWETLKTEIDNVRRARAAASSTPQPMNLSAWYPGTRSFPERQPKVARQGRRPKLARTTSRKRHVLATTVR